MSFFEFCKWKHYRLFKRVTIPWKFVKRQKRNTPFQYHNMSTGVWERGDSLTGVKIVTDKEGPPMFTKSAKEYLTTPLTLCKLR